MGTVRCLLADHAPALYEQHIQLQGTLEIPAGDLRHDGGILKTAPQDAALSVYDELQTVCGADASDPADVLCLSETERGISGAQSVSVRQ